MARWDNILNLPVQDPAGTEFSAAELTWYKVEGWRQNLDDVALIPFRRVADFVRGESANTDCPTKFRVEARRRKQNGAACKPRVDGYLEYILYWCSYGPDDHRKGGTSRLSRMCIKPSQRKSPAGRPHTKRGCLCHFIVKRLCAQPEVALIIYNQRKHVDKNGAPCHGSLDNKAIGTPAMFAPFISEELRQRITSLLYAGFSVENIMENHAKFVQRHGGPTNRDDLVTLRFVRTIERDIRRSTFEYDADDVASVKMWVENHQNQVFFFQEATGSSPFILGIQTEWQLQQMIRFGNNSLIALNSRAGAKKLKYPVLSLLVFDSNNAAIPVAWVISASTTNHDLEKWMQALCKRVHAKNASWKLDGFIIDDALTETGTISCLFNCAILLCLWHVRHAWQKNVIKKCANVEIQKEMLKQLGDLMDNACRNLNVMNGLYGFLEDFVDHEGFLNYFREHWLPNLEFWIKAMQTFLIASLETSAVIEAYHFNLKSQLLNEENDSSYQRVDWLAHKLSTVVHSYYWFDLFSNENDFCEYVSDKEMASTSWRKALYIPDSDVLLNDQNLNMVKVVSQSDSSQLYTVWNPGSEFSFCDCAWFKSGMMCKHVIKAGMVWRRCKEVEPSMALRTYHKALQSLSSHPPKSSMVLDQAIVLAINMHQDLKRVLGYSRPGESTSFGSENLNWVCRKTRLSRTKKRVVNEFGFSPLNESSTGIDQEERA